MKDIISIIIPVYNSGSFLVQCLDSVKKQSYKDLQIIIVYTDSIDDSLDICKRYVEKDHRFEIVMNKENIRRASYARNLGLMHVKGEYLGFVDSDDVIAEDMCEILYNRIKKYNADIVMCNLTKNRELLMKSYDEERIWGQEETQYEFLRKTFNEGVVCKLFAWNKVRYLRFDFNLDIAEDVQYVWKAIGLSTKNVYIPAQRYFYRRNYDSITHQFKEKQCRDAMDVLKTIGDTIDSNNREFIDMVNFREKILCAQNFISMKQLGINNTHFENELRSEMKKKRFQIRGFKNFPITVRLMGVLMGINPDMGYGLYHMYDLIRKRKMRCVD